MANPKHLEVLKQGVGVWNEWRIKNPGTSPDLMGADISSLRIPPYNLLLEAKDRLSEGLFFESFYFEEVNTSYLSRINFRATFLQGAILTSVSLRGADLTGANLNEAKLDGANLNKARLKKIMSRSADLTRANLHGADLTESSFFRTNFTEAELEAADFNRANIGECNFTGIDLSSAINLETVDHSGPSEISVSTLYKSGGEIPKLFLRGCGVPEELIVYLPSLINSRQGIEFYSCFISYSHVDKSFARRLHDTLQSRGSSLSTR